MFKKSYVITVSSVGGVCFVESEFLPEVTR